MSIRTPASVQTVEQAVDLPSGQATESQITISGSTRDEIGLFSKARKRNCSWRRGRSVSAYLRQPRTRTRPLTIVTAMSLIGPSQHLYPLEVRLLLTHSLSIIYSGIYVTSHDYALTPFFAITSAMNPDLTPEPPLELHFWEEGCHLRTRQKHKSEIGTPQGETRV